jgi:hypothetical protein
MIFISIFANAQELYYDEDLPSGSLFDISYSIFVGQSRMPVFLDEAFISIDVPGFPLVNETLPEIQINKGLYLGSTIHLNKNWYAGISFNTSTESNSVKRDNDHIGSLGLNMGYQFIFSPKQELFSIAFETGLAGARISRGLSIFENYESVRINRYALAVTPTIRLEINLFLQKFYLFFQAKYFYRFYERAKIIFTEEKNRHDDDPISSSIRFSNPGVNASQGARLNLNHLYEFAIGIRYHVNF